MIHWLGIRLAGVILVLVVRGAVVTQIRDGRLGEGGGVLGGRMATQGAGDVRQDAGDLLVKGSTHGEKRGSRRWKVHQFSNANSTQ